MPVFRPDPYPAFNFLVESPALGGDAESLLAGFAEVSGLEVEQTYIEYRNGNERSLAPRLLPGLVRYAPLVLRRGVVGDGALWQWMQAAVNGSAEPANCRITLLDEQRQPVMAWRVRNARPCRLSGPCLDANTSAVAIESLEIVHGGLELVD